MGKTTAPLADPDLGVGDRVNLAYSGPDVTYGRGQGLVVATGLHTEFGQVTGLLAAVMAVVLIAGLGVWRGEPLLEVLISI